MQNDLNITLELRTAISHKSNRRWVAIGFNLGYRFFALTYDTSVIAEILNVPTGLLCRWLDCLPSETAEIVAYQLSSLSLGYLRNLAHSLETVIKDSSVSSEPDKED